VSDEGVDRRTIVVLNKRYEGGRLFNALGHVVLGLGADAVDRDDLWIQEYRDADGIVYPHISYHPVIVLKADNGNHLRRFRMDLEREGLPFSSFVHTMFEGGTPVQLSTTEKTTSDELDYVAVATFGPADTLRQLTRKFRIYS
jgi:hypothetical protein